MDTALKFAGILLMAVIGAAAWLHEPQCTAEESASLVRAREERDAAAHARKMEEEASRRETMATREWAERQCQMANQAQLDANTVSVGEYVGLKLIGF